MLVQGRSFTESSTNTPTPKKTCLQTPTMISKMFLQKSFFTDTPVDMTQKSTEKDTDSPVTVENTTDIPMNNTQ